MTLASLLPAVAQAAVISQTVTGNLLGTQSLLQFNPALGVLTGVTFQLASAASGTATATGILVPATIIPAFCTPGLVTVGFSIAGYDSNLNTNLTSAVTPTGTPANGCTASAAFNRTINLGPTAALGPLTDYIGISTMPFNFAIGSATTSTWTGTLTVNYSYQTPEPGTWLMVGSALMALAWRKRSA